METGTSPRPCTFVTLERFGLLALETCFGNPVASYPLVICVLDWSFAQDSGDVEDAEARGERGVVETGGGKFYVQT